MWPNPQETADLVIFTEEILTEKLHFFVQWSLNPSKKNNIPKKVTLWTYEYHERTLSEAHLLTTTYIVSHHKQTIVSKNARISELYIHCSPGCASITNSFWRICCKGTNINAVTLTETWLQYYKYQQNYVQIQHYFKTEEAK